MGAMKEVDLIFVGNFVGLWKAVDMLKRIDDLINIVLYQLLGADLRFLVQRTMSHATLIAVNALIERIQQTYVIMIGAQFAQLVDSALNIEIVIPGRLLFQSPFSAPSRLVMGISGFQPFSVGPRATHISFKFRLG